MVLLFIKRRHTKWRGYLLAMIFCLRSLTGAFAQDMHRSADEYDIRLAKGRVHYQVTPNQISVTLNDSATTKQAALFFAAHPALFGAGAVIQKLRERDKTYLITLPGRLKGQEYLDTLKVLNASSVIKYVSPVLKYKDQNIQIPYDMFFVKIRDPSGLDTLRKYAALFAFDIEREAYPNIYFCRTRKTSAGNSFELAAWLQNLDEFEYAEPDYIYFANCATNDSLYPKQWHLQNTGQFPGAIPGCDIGITDAWKITTGIPEVSVAILDVFGDSSQFYHPDFSFAATYDATGTGFGIDSVQYKNRFSAHGIACGGLIGAYTNNITGMAGIAYNCKVIAVKLGNFIDSTGGSWESTGNTLTNGIEWAGQNCDILSNSNTFGRDTNTSSLVENALTDIINYGRHGKGGFFFSSAGNDNNPAIYYPASSFNAIAVGACNFCNGRKNPFDCIGNNWGSSYGLGLDVMAPGDSIFTLDIPGPLGFFQWDYINFDGTSASCPIAAGVMALILSADTNLTYDCARYALESTCVKIDLNGAYKYASNVPNQSNGTWNEQVGYGMINAANALNYVVSGLHDCSYTETSPTAIQIFPNPSSSLIYIDTKIIDTVTVSIYDLEGRIVMKNYQVTSNREAIDISYLNAGLYLVRVQSESGEYLTATRLVKL